MNGWLDLRISLGVIINIVVMVVTLVGIYWRMREMIFKLHAQNDLRLAGLETKMDSIWEWFTKRLERRSDRSEDIG